MLHEAHFVRGLIKETSDTNGHDTAIDPVNTAVLDLQQ